MIVDTSALVAIVKAEPEREALVRALAAAPHARMSAATHLELCLVVDGLRNPVMSRRLDQLLTKLEVDIVEVTAEHAQVGRAAYRDYGRGSGHPAHLNFGDVFAYALAAVSGEPLLFQGDDFSHTDLTRAL